MSKHIVEIKNNKLVKAPYYLLGECNYDYVDENGEKLMILLNLIPSKMLSKQ